MTGGESGTSYNSVTLAEELMAILDRSAYARSNHPLELAVGLDLIFRAFRLLAFEKLIPVREQFPATNQALMTVPEAPVDVVRDALIHPTDFLSPIDLIDLLSPGDRECVAPALHRGWQDRTRSCQHARRVATDAAGFTLHPDQCDALLAGQAFINRALHVPPPVDLAVGEIRRIFGPVLAVIERLAERTGSEHLTSVSRLITEA